MFEFESSVISYGSQTLSGAAQAASQFESSVISYGSQTKMAVDYKIMGLRVV